MSTVTNGPICRRRIGESGAGKTEASKQLMQYMTKVLSDFIGRWGVYIHDPFLYQQWKQYQMQCCYSCQVQSLAAYAGTDEAQPEVQ